MGDGARARPDEEEEGLAGPALGGIFAEEAGALPGGEMGLREPEDQGVGLCSDRRGRGRPGPSRGRGHEVVPEAFPGVPERLAGERNVRGNRHGVKGNEGKKQEDEGKIGGKTSVKQRKRNENLRVVE